MTGAGLLSRIVVRKTGRRAAEGKQAVPAADKAADGEGGAAAANDGDVSMIGADADVAREQFPFIFNLLRGHAISARKLGPQPVSADNRRSKTSPHHHQQQLQQPRKPAAVAAYRQRQASRGTPFILTVNRQILELLVLWQTAGRSTCWRDVVAAFKQFCQEFQNADSD